MAMKTIDDLLCCRIRLTISLNPAAGRTATTLPLMKSRMVLCMVTPSLSRDVSRPGPARLVPGPSQIG
jgi:hypothetical protein